MQTLADMVLVPLEGVYEFLMTTRKHAPRPPLLHGQAGEQAFL
jgi:hypothetical protein